MFVSLSAKGNLDETSESKEEEEARSRLTSAAMNLLERML
jgi:hypothetical protein